MPSSACRHLEWTPWLLILSLPSLDPSLSLLLTDIIIQPTSLNKPQATLFTFFPLLIACCSLNPVASTQKCFLNPRLSTLPAYPEGLHLSICLNSSPSSLLLLQQPLFCRLQVMPRLLLMPSKAPPRSHHTSPATST